MKQILMILAMAIVLVPGSLVAAQSETPTPTGPPLDGRIGGTVASFEALYGTPKDPVGTEPTDARIYENADLAHLLAYQIDGYIWQASYFSGPGKETARPAWSKAEAIDAAMKLMPLDSKCGKPEKTYSESRLRVECTSEALKAIFFAADYARLDQLGDPGTVSFALIARDKKNKEFTTVVASLGTMSNFEAGIVSANATDAANKTPEDERCPRGYDSGGLGLAIQDWEAENGPDEGPPNGLTSSELRYYDNRQIMINIADGCIFLLSYQFGAIDAATAEAISLTFIPSDAVFLRQEPTDTGFRDIYHSDSLATQMPVQVGDQPLGTFVVVFDIFPDAPEDSTLLVGPGDR